MVEIVGGAVVLVSNETYISPLCQVGKNSSANFSHFFTKAKSSRLFLFIFIPSSKVIHDIRRNPPFSLLLYTSSHRRGVIYAHVPLIILMCKVSFSKIKHWELSNPTAISSLINRRNHISLHDFFEFCVHEIQLFHSYIFPAPTEIQKLEITTVLANNNFRKVQFHRYRHNDVCSQEKDGFDEFDTNG